MSENIAASIIIPTLNEEKYLPLLLESLLKVQAPLDIIVVDGNSEDKTLKVIEAFKPRFVGSSSLRVMSSPQRNISLQRNIGAGAARYPIFIFCDADNLFPSTQRYKMMISEFLDNNYVVAAPAIVFIENGLGVKFIDRSFYLMQKTLLLFGRPYFAGSFLLTTKETFNKIRGFNPAIRLAEDVDYSLRASKQGRYGMLNAKIETSARRFLKYGYWWLFKQVPELTRFVITGKVNHEKIFYPFGEYN